MYTQCPQCHAVFQLTAEQLKAAGGDVRCGQCLTIFNALEHLSEVLPSEESLPPQPANSDNDASHYADWTWEDTAAEAPQPEAGSEDSFDFGDIEAAAAEVYENVSLEPEGPTATEIPDAGLSYDETVDAVLSGDQAAAEPPVHESSDEALGESADEPLVEPQSFSEPLGADEVINIEPEDIPVAADYQTSMASQLAADTAEEATTSSPETATESAEPETVIPTLIREQLEEAEAEELRRPSPVWAVGGILLMLVFMGQVLFFSRHDLARDATFGPWVVKACETLGCTIQRKVSIKDIAILGWDVRSHPAVARALTASTSMVNNADFNQPFPLLELRFSDMNGTPVSQRRFKPQEYLNDPALLKQGMQPDTPVHIELDLLDPGKNAVNFEFIPVALPHVALVTK